MLRTSLCAVPAFMRVEPVTTSAPVSVTIAMSASFASGDPSLHVSPTVAQPSDFAYPSAPSTYSAPPAALMPTTQSAAARFAALTSRSPNAALSSSGSPARYSASTPPAITPRIVPSGTPNVGHASDASSTPSLPDVPAPT